MSKPIVHQFSWEKKCNSYLGEVYLLHFIDPFEKARNITVGVAPEFGSNIFKLKVGEFDLIYTDEKALSQHDFTGCFVLWPFPNRVRERKYTFKGETHSLADVTIPRGNAVLVHGLVRDRVWEAAEPVVYDDRVEMATTVEMSEGCRYFGDFPFPSRLSLHFSLSAKGLRVGYSVENLGDKELPFGFGLHPAFSTLFSDKKDIVIFVPAQSVMEADNELLPTGKVWDVKDVRFRTYDLSKPRAISDMQLDHVFTGLENGKFAGIDYKKQKIKVQIRTSEEFKYSVVYTMESEKLVCLEPQTCPTNAINLAAEGKDELANLLVAKPGKRHEGFVEFCIRMYPND